MPRSPTVRIALRSQQAHLLSPRPDADTIGYVRVSTEQQTEEHRSSLGDQRRAILQRAKELGRVLLPAAIFEDPGVSGATAEGRPGFMAMMQYCEQHPKPAATPGVVIVLNDSRFGRFDDPKEALMWQFVLQHRHGWKVRFCEGDDHGEGMGRDVVRLIGSAQASEYRANLKRTARRAARSTAEQGRWQNEAPFGYRRLAIRADGSSRVLEIGQRKSDDEIVKLTAGPEEEQAIVRSSFAQYGSGVVTQGMLARELLERWPGRKWSSTTVWALLNNRAYVGDVVWCRRAHDATERKQTPVRPADQWVEVRDAHPALVSRELFAVVQARLHQNRRVNKAAAGPYPLSGLITCAVCGDRFTGGGGKKGPPGDPHRYKKYQERTSSYPSYKTTCPGHIPTLSKRWLEPVIIEEIASVVSDPAVQQLIASELDKALANAIGGGTDRQLALRKEKDRLIAQRQRVIDAIASGIISDQDARQKMGDLSGRLEAAQSEAERTEFSQRRVKGVVQVRDRVLALASDFPELARRASGPALRELIRPWLAAAVFDKRTHVLTLTIRKVPHVVPSQETGGCSPSSSLTSRAGVVPETNPRHLVIVKRFDVPRHPRLVVRCAHGHALEGPNVYRDPGAGRRHCRKCKAAQRKRAS